MDVRSAKKLASVTSLLNLSPRTSTEDRRVWPRDIHRNEEHGGDRCTAPDSTTVANKYNAYRMPTWTEHVHPQTQTRPPIDLWAGGGVGEGEGGAP